MIHQWSPRAKAPFIVLSAAMMSPERVEEELFGSEAEGVVRPGLLEHAHGGTLFLDEIADMPLTTQAQDPARADRPELSPGRRAAAGQGRRPRALGDLAQPVRTRSPPGASARTCSTGSTSSRCASRRCASGARTSPSWSAISSPASPPSGGCRRRRISEEAMAALQAHDWPGNVRQLRNIIERTIILAPGDRVSCIEVDLLPPEILDNQSAIGGSSAAMAIMGSPLREAREIVRARISQDPDPPLFRQHLAHRVVHRHGALGAAPEAQGAGHRRQARGRGVGRVAHGRASR